MKNAVYILVGIVLTIGCNQRENATELATVEQVKIDSLENKLNEALYAGALLEQVGVYLDSIDANRKWVKVDLETGITETDYIERMKSLNLYTQKAEWTIGELEKTRSAYASQVKRLKAELESTMREVAILQTTVAEYKEENDELNGVLFITESQLVETELALEGKQEELYNADKEISDLMNKLVLTEAETHFAQGEGMENVANHIDFAPKRKKESLQIALEHYQKAEDLGHISASDRISKIKKQLKLE